MRFLCFFNSMCVGKINVIEKVINECKIDWRFIFMEKVNAFVIII